MAKGGKSEPAARLWQAGELSLDEAVLAFTVGDDPLLDRELLPFDCLASAAHAHMLAAAGVISTADRDALLAALHKARDKALAGEFEIQREHEDGHTALEAFLTAELGDLGKTIHAARSRNDQVLMALRLLVRDRLLSIADRVATLVGALLERGAAERQTLMPGFTHTRQAMPSSAGQLLFAVAEDLVVDLGGVEVALAQASRSAAGSAAGFGVPLKIDREVVRDKLGLAALELNTVHAQNTRGKLEAATLFALHQVSITLGRFATDLITFSSEVYAFFKLPDELTTGSSIMPQKKNPDLLELVRALSAGLQGRYVEVTSLLHGLGAGYHRDLQRSKGPLLKSLAEMDSALVVMQRAAERLHIDRDRCRAAMGDDILATDRVYAEVRDGVPFRDAYRRVKEGGGGKVSLDGVLDKRQHAGAPGTDQSRPLGDALAQIMSRLESHRAGARTARALLDR